MGQQTRPARPRPCPCRWAGLRTPHPRLCPRFSPLCLQAGAGQKFRPIPPGQPSSNDLSSLHLGGSLGLMLHVGPRAPQGDALSCPRVNLLYWPSKLPHLSKLQAPRGSSPLTTYTTLISGSIQCLSRLLIFLVLLLGEGGATRAEI